jgi:predicted DNA-binding transcriptional regulator AlpA
MESIVNIETVKFDQLPDTSFVNVKTVAQVLGVSVGSVWRYTKDGVLPAPVKLSANTTRWQVGNLRRWMAGMAKGGAA